jgi:hypothetical protein
MGGEIPDDIMAAARKALCFEGGYIDSPDIVSAVEGAILAERQRCADICRTIELSGGGIWHAADIITEHACMPTHITRGDQYD